jgi:hypothetical protein
VKTRSERKGKRGQEEGQADIYHIAFIVSQYLISLLDAVVAHRVWNNLWATSSHARSSLIVSQAIVT